MKFKLNEKSQVTIELEPNEKLELFSEVSRLNNEQIEPFTKWINDPNISIEIKESYSENKINFMHSESFIIQFMLRCGFTEKEVCQCFNLPF